MPATKLIFIKLMLEIADDQRFVMQLNDSQKLDYLLSLLMAGLTGNEIPIDPSWFKSRFHLSKSCQEIDQNLKQIEKIFRKFVRYKGKYKFRNFRQLHNYIYKEKENSTSILKEYLKSSPIDSNLFLIISNLINFYITIKGYEDTSIDMRERNRYGRVLKELLVKAKGQKYIVRDCIKWVSEQGYNDWTLETCFKKWPDFEKTCKVGAKTVDLRRRLYEGTPPPEESPL